MTKKQLEDSIIAVYGELYNVHKTAEGLSETGANFKTYHATVLSKTNGTKDLATRYYVENEGTPEENATFMADQDLEALAKRVAVPVAKTPEEQELEQLNNLIKQKKLELQAEIEAKKQLGLV